MELMSDRPAMAIITPYPLVAEGIRTLVLKEYPTMQIMATTLLERGWMDFIVPDLRLIIMDVVQAYYNQKSVADIRKHFPQVGLVGLQHSEIGRNILSLFDDIVSLHMGLESVGNVIRPYIEGQQMRQHAPRLSRREIEVLKLLVRGKTAKEIGQELCISMHTVTSHRKNLSTKLGIKSIPGMAIYAVSLNLMEPTDAKCGN